MTSTEIAVSSRWWSLTGNKMKSVEHAMTNIFWPKVQKTDSCWIWLGCKGPNGYGHLTALRKHYLAHRFSYEMFLGTIGDGLTIDHLCRNRACVNPAHLETVTLKENIRRSPLLTCRASATHCKNGHLLDAKITFVSKEGRRVCRTCRNKHAKTFRENRKTNHLTKSSPPV